MCCNSPGQRVSFPLRVDVGGLVRQNRLLPLTVRLFSFLAFPQGFPPLGPLPRILLPQGTFVVWPVTLNSCSVIPIAFVGSSPFSIFLSPMFPTLLVMPCLKPVSQAQCFFVFVFHVPGLFTLQLIVWFVPFCFTF